MEVDRLSEGLTRINMDMEADAKHGVYWPGFVALGAATFAIFNFLTRWLLPGETRGRALSVQRVRVVRISGNRCQRKRATFLKR